jgi:uncharacterized protein YsxB (DUF464 family)
VLKINAGNILSVPVDGIANVKMAKYDVALTILCATICTLGICFLAAIIEFKSSGGFLKLSNI